MPYNIQKMSRSALEEILLVLKNVKKGFKTSRKKKKIFHYEVGALEGVTKFQHLRIMNNLKSSGLIKERIVRTFFTSLFKEFQDVCIISLNKEFKDFHKATKRRISELKSISKPEEEIKVKFYSERNRRLLLGKYRIQIARHEGNNNAHEIMAYIFTDNRENLEDKFFYSEIAEKRFGAKYNSKDKYAHQPYSGACERINEIVMRATDGKVKEFLKFNHSKIGHVKVNPKYR
jgi:hypothetical protein